MNLPQYKVQRSLCGLFEFGTATTKPSLKTQGLEHSQKQLLLGCVLKNLKNAKDRQASHVTRSLSDVLVKNTLAYPRGLI